MLSFSDLGATPDSALPPLPPDGLEPPPPPDPPWRGVDVAIVLLVTLFAMVLALALGTLVIALLGQARGWHLAGIQPMADVRFVLMAQTVGLAAGLGFAALWFKQLYQTPFWSTIAWRRVAGSTAAAIALGGLAFSLTLQFLGHYLPMPRELPIDRLFSAQSAWALAIYGVGVAPFFEEFLFRGLIYPSLRRTFSEGMSPAEAREWRPIVWVVALIGAVIAGFAVMLRNLRQMPLDPRVLAGLVLALALGIFAGPLLQLLAALLRWMAGWRKPELLAILLTGFLFGLVHSSQLADAVVPVLMLTLVGVVLTLIRARTGSFLASWIFHCAYNGTLFLLLFFSTQGFHNFERLLR